jgi:superfamily I DNA and RNA helicase
VSLWWTKRDQLDKDQVTLIEDLPLRENFLVCGPPGSGKTNVLLRRAQFVRTQNMPNVMVLTYTRALVEFVKTGCFDQGREIFPRSCVSTLESWIRSLYRTHGVDLPVEPSGPDRYRQWRLALASGALGFASKGKLPKLDTLFIDEVQDLYGVEVDLLRTWGRVLFLTGDSKQRIHDATDGMQAVEKVISQSNRRTLTSHYRLAPEICQMADRILQSTGQNSLQANSFYSGPKPGRIDVVGPLSKDDQLARCATTLKSQLRVYADFLRQGDRLGIVVARRNDRDTVLQFLESDKDLAGKAQIIRARDDTEDDGDFDPAFQDGKSIAILTVKGCKGIEFRALHWLFSEELDQYHAAEHYYTVITRAKTSLDIYHGGNLPQLLARSYAPPGKDLWT